MWVFVCVCMWLNVVPLIKMSDVADYLTFSKLFLKLEDRERDRERRRYVKLQEEVRDASKTTNGKGGAPVTSIHDRR